MLCHKIKFILFLVICSILMTFLELILINKDFNYKFVINQNDLGPKLSERALAYLNSYYQAQMKPVSQDQMLENAEHSSNIALNYWHEWNRRLSKMENNWSDDRLNTCRSKPPPIESIHFNNIYWQTISPTEDLNLYLYNAFFDDRGNVSKVRVIGVSDHFYRLAYGTNLSCLMYFSGQSRAVLTRVTHIDELSYDFGNYYKRKGYYLPVLLTCDIPAGVGGRVPRAVSLKMSSDCSENLHNFLKVIYNRSPDNHLLDNRFGVCVRALYYQNIDFSLRLIEWLELMKILGADQVFLYSFTTHPNMERVMDYYQTRGFVDWRRTTHPGLQPNDKYLDELYIRTMGNKMFPQETLELNDCLYRNIYRYKYLVVLDVDEVIVPVAQHNWTAMIQQIKSSIKDQSKVDTFGSYIFRQSRVFSDVETDANDPKRLMYTMRHLNRQNFTSKAPKSIHLSQNIKVIWNHAPVKCIPRDKCPLHWVNKDIGYLMHYRNGIYLPDNCSELQECSVYDPIITKYKSPLENNIEYTIRDIATLDLNQNHAK